MIEKNLYKVAIKNHFRWETSIGNLSVEDLWELPLTSRNKVNLDKLAQTIHKEIKDESEVSFVNKSENSKRQILQDKLDILIDIINTKLEEAEKMQKAREKKEKKQKILDIIQEKELESLKDLDLEELKKLVQD